LPNCNITISPQSSSLVDQYFPAWYTCVLLQIDTQKLHTSSISVKKNAALLCLQKISSITIPKQQTSLSFNFLGLFQMGQIALRPVTEPVSKNHCINPTLLRPGSDVQILPLPIILVKKLNVVLAAIRCLRCFRRFLLLIQETYEG